MAGGRPLLFKTPAELEAKIEAYFASCWEEVWDEQEIDAVDTKGNSVKEIIWVQRFDKEGNALLKQTKPYLITGLALALNTSRTTLINYEERDEFFNTIKKAKDMCEHFLEHGMIQGIIPAVPGIFNAKNNYMWKDRTEVLQDVTGGLDLKSLLGQEEKSKDA